MGRIFGEIARVVTRYEGHIDKFIGDAIYAMKGKHADQEITPAILSKFNLQTNHYQLPFEKSDRYMIKLSVKR